MKQTRKHKINRLLVTIQSHKKGIEAEKLIGAVSLKEASARRTILEYLKTLLVNGLIIKKNERYYPSKEKQSNL